MKRFRTDLLNGVVWEQILIFFFPVFFGTIFQQLYNTVDAIVVGNFVGKEALGAVGGSTGTLTNLLVGFLVGLSSGATVVIAQFYGNRDTERVPVTVSTGMVMSIVFGFILTVLGYIFAPQLLHLLNVPDDIFPYSVTYIRIFFIGLIPTLIYNTGSGVLRAVGDSKRPLYFLIAACITNIVLDLLFVAVLNMGVAGAAIATVIAQVVSCVLTLFVLYKTEDCYRFNLKNIQFDKDILIQIIQFGLPTGIQSALYSVANLFVQASVNGYGTDTVAAYTAFGKIDATFWNASGALGTAVLTFAGQNFGAGNIKRVKKGFHQSIAIYLIMSLSITGVCYLFGPTLFRLFTPDEAVIKIGLKMLYFICPFWSTFVFVEIFSSGIRACGDSLIPMITTAVGIGAFRILWILFFPDKTIFEVLVCYPISWVLTSTLFVLYYLQGGWLKRSLKHREKIMNTK